MSEMKDTDNIDCHLQQIGMGTLVCRAAKQNGEHSTNEVNPEICFVCPSGIIYRNVGCDSVLPKLSIYAYGNMQRSLHVDDLFCKIRKRSTSLEYCEKCTLKVAETTKEIVGEMRDTFEKEEFYTAFKDLDKAKLAMRDGKYESAITYSTAMLESTIRIIHEKMFAIMPDKLAISDLFKSVRSVLRLNGIDEEGSVSTLINNINGCITAIGFIRNSISDAHGKGINSPVVDSYVAELSINICSAMATFLIRRFKVIKETT